MQWLWSKQSRVERAQHKEIVSISLKTWQGAGIHREELEFMLKVAVESYDKKLMKIQKNFKGEENMTEDSVLWLEEVGKED